MSTCICNSCKNLKTVVDEKENQVDGITEECVFGFPSEVCSECVEGDCTLTCEHYIEDEDEEELTTVACVMCGKELKVLASNMETGDVYCPICFLNK